MCRGSLQAVQNVAVQGHVGSDSSPLGSALIATLSDRLHLQLRDSTFLTYTYAACCRPSGDKPHVGTARVTVHKTLRVTSTRSIIRGSNGIPDQAEASNPARAGFFPLPQ